MRRPLIATCLLVLAACASAPAPVAPARPQAPPPPPAPVVVPAAPIPRVWPSAFAGALDARGTPHAQPVPLPPDAQGRARWLAFVGTPDVAEAAWHVAVAADGTVAVEPVERWPTAVKVIGATTADRAAYVLLETVGALDQPAGLRGVWIDGPSPFDATPGALADVHDLDDLTARIAAPAVTGTPERNAVSLLATLRAANASGESLVKTLAAEGADLGTSWQSTFVQSLAHLDGQGSGPATAVDRALAIVHDAVDTQACGSDACEAWTDSGHAIVRFVVEGGRWVIRAIVEDARPQRLPATGAPAVVEASTDTSSTAGLLGERARGVVQVLGEAPLGPSGGTIGVGLTDLTPGAPVIALREGLASRVFVADDVSARVPGNPRWSAAFADVDGDGRSDVVLRLDATREDGSAVAWTQAYLAPAPSVQTTTLQPDLASALAMLDAPDVRAAARAATSIPTRPVARDEACRLLNGAGSLAGFRRTATAGARVLLFDEPGLPTWRPKIVPADKLTADEVRPLASHCADLVCDARRPYCAWTAGTDSQHFWFTWQNGQLALLAAADYEGE